jgi:CelD/BcsL family acetyltransferase involved in cellulose biosynthesis
MSKYTIDIVRTADALAACGPRWNDLLRESRADSIFLTWEWICSWSESFLGKGRELLVLMLRDDQDLVGIAPWYINTVRVGPFPVRRLELLGTPEWGSDYVDVIARRGKEREVAEALCEYLCGDFEARWDCLLFRDVPADSIFMEFFMGALESRGKYLALKRGSYCPYVDLPDGKKRLHDSMRPHRRLQFRRDLRLLNAVGPFRHTTVREADGIGSIRPFLDLYELRWGKIPENHLLFLERFLRRSCRNRWVEINTLRAGDEDIAAIFHLIYGNVKYCYMTVVNKRFNRKVSVGNVLIGLSLEDSAENGIGRYNFLKGGEPYKFHWADRGDRLIQIELYRSRFPCALAYLLEAGKNLGKIVFR